MRYSSRKALAFLGKDVGRDVVEGKPYMNLKTAIGREKAVQAIDVHRECTNCVVTLWVMSQF